MTPDQKLLVSAVKLHLSPQELAELDALLPIVQDWEWVVQLLTQQGSAPLFYTKLPLLVNSKLIPQEVQQSLQQVYYRTLSRSMMLYKALAEVLDTLHEKGISVLVLKGAYLSECMYGDIALRQFSDLDLLIHEVDGEQSKAALKAIGYIPAPSKGLSEFVDSKADFVHYTPLYKNNISVELHIRLHIQNERFCLHPDLLWQHALTQTIAGREVLVPDNCDMLIHVVLHLHKHFKEGHIQFTSFNDIVNILTEQKIDWELLQQRVEQYNAQEEVYSYLLLVASYYNIILPTSISEKFSSLLTPAFCNRFEAFLNGEVFEQENQSAVPAHMANIAVLHGLGEHLHYFRDLVFPSKAFMLDKYLNEDTSRRRKFSIQCWWLYYPYRWGVGIKAFFQLLLVKK